MTTDAVRRLQSNLTTTLRFPQARKGHTLATPTRKVQEKSASALQDEALSPTSSDRKPGSSAKPGIEDDALQATTAGDSDRRSLSSDGPAPYQVQPHSQEVETVNGNGPRMTCLLKTGIWSRVRYTSRGSVCSRPNYENSLSTC